MVTAIWSWRWTVGYGYQWKRERTATVADAEAWLKVFRADEPGVTFVASLQRPASIRKGRG